MTDLPNHISTFFVDLVKEKIKSINEYPDNGNVK